MKLYQVIGVHISTYTYLFEKDGQIYLEDRFGQVKRYNNLLGFHTNKKTALEAAIYNTEELLENLQNELENE